jgi:hypothetical protein
LLAPARFNDSVRPWLIALVITGGASTFVSFAVRPSIRIDNGGRQPVQIWIDGKPSIVAQPMNGLGKRPEVSLPMGLHTFGWSPMGASAPKETTAARKVQWMGDHLYNPGRAACYWLEVSTYGSANDKGVAQGPQTLDDFYAFGHIDNWFADNPKSISTKGSGGTRTSVAPMKICQELVEHGCSVAVRSEMLDCAVKAYASKSKTAFNECLDEAVVRCKKEGGK